MSVSGKKYQVTISCIEHHMALVEVIAPSAAKAREIVEAMDPHRLEFWPFDSEVTVQKVEELDSRTEAEEV